MLSILLGKISLFLIVTIKALLPGQAVPTTIEETADVIYSRLSSMDLADRAYIEVPFAVNLDYVKKLQKVYATKAWDSRVYKKNFDYADAYVPYNFEVKNGKYFIKFSSDGNQDKYTKEVEAKFKKYDKVLRDEINSWGKDLTDLEKLEKINHYIVSNIKYDDSLSISDWINALDKKKGICHAYAEIFQRMTALCNLESRIVTSPTHAFNAVKLNGEWKFFDSCWNIYSEKQWFNLTYEELLEKDKIYPAYDGTYNNHEIDEYYLKKVLKMIK